MATQLLLLRHGSAAEEEPKPLTKEGEDEATYAANALLAYLELKSEFLPRHADGTPVAVTLFHSGKERAAQTALIVAGKLKEAGCDVTEQASAEELSPNAEPAAAHKLVEGASTPLVVMVGHLPHLHKLAAALGVEQTSADIFTPAGGVLLHRSDATWALAHVCANGVNWWMRGVSVHIRADANED